MRKYEKQPSLEDKKYNTTFTKSSGFISNVAKKVASSSRKKEKSGSRRRNSESGLGIGQVASAEAEYDFAILLVASKQEELDFDKKNLRSSFKETRSTEY